MKRNLKEKGITLLALIITIVLLLIVSGVTLNIALGDNGLLNKSKEAVNKGKLSQTEELIKMDLLAAYIDAEITGLSKPSNETIKTIVEKHGGTINESNPNVIQTPNGEIKLDGILNDTSSDTNNTDELNKTIASLNNRITELNKELETERSEKARLESEITNLNSQVASWKEKAEAGEITIGEKNTEIERLNNEITTKNNELEEKTKEITSLNESLSSVTEQKGTLETRVTNLESEVAEKDETITAQEATIASKTETINGLNTTIEGLNTSIENLNSQIEVANTEKETLEGEIIDLNGQVASWKKKAEDGEVGIADRDATISDLNNQITEKNSEITTKTQTINELSEEKATLTTQKSNLETEKANLETQVANLQERVTDLEGELQSGAKKYMNIEGTLTLVDTKEVYGSEVLGYTCDRSDASWQLFYIDEMDNNRVYLIASDYMVPPSNNASIKMEESRDSSCPKAYKFNDTILGNYKETIPSTTFTRRWLTDYVDESASSQTNLQATNYLLDQNIWNEYKGTKATGAYGGPTLPLFAASFNDICDPSVRIGYERNGTGYQVRKGTGNMSDYQSGYGNTSTQKGMYFKGNNTNSAYGLWLVSPSSNYTSSVMYASYPGIVYCRNYNGDATLGVRPVVSLQSNIQFTKNPNGTFTINS